MCAQSPVTVVEEEMILCQFVLGSAVHTRQRVVGTLKFIAQTVQRIYRLLLHLFFLLQQCR